MVADSLPRTCTVPGSGTTITNNGDGTYTETPDAGTEDVKCSFMAAAGNERVVGGAVAEVGNYVLTFEHGVILRPNVTIVVDATDEESERTFQLVAPLDTSQPVGIRWLATEG